MKTIRITAFLLLVTFAAGAKTPAVKNIIFMVGDGMGISQMTSAMVEGRYAPMNFDRAQSVGLVKTYSANNPVTDSGAAATAFACGVKTNNATIGLDAKGESHPSIMEKARSRGMATGFVVTSTVTDATPSGFYAHVPSRHQYEDIALQLVRSDIDVWMGGGGKYFTERADGRDLSDTLRARGYTVAATLDEVQAATGRVAGIMDSGYMPAWKSGRQGYLPAATAKTLDLLLAQSRGKGFFAMIEGSQIDSGGHNNDFDKILNETRDFDQAVGVAMDFADRHPGTLVIVAADHETGGLALTGEDEDFNHADVKLAYRFATGGHTGVMTALLAYGPGAAEFNRIMENTEVNRLMCKLLKLN